MDNLYDFYISRRDAYGERILFDNRTTYAGAVEAAMARAAFLRRKGLGKGDVIGILAGNSADWCVTYMAITSLGAIALPLDTTLAPADYARMLGEVRAKAVFVSGDFRGLVRGVPVFGVEAGRSTGDPRGFRPARVSPDHTASYLFTSGTTGRAKVVALSHANLFKTAIATSEYLGLNERDQLLCILPLYHAYAFVANFIGPFAAGSSLVFQPSLKGPDIMRSLAENRITIFPAAPQLWELFLDGILNRVKADSLFKYRLLLFMLAVAPALRAMGLSAVPRRVFAPVRALFGGSMRFFISGGAPLKRSYFNRYNRMGLTVIEGYGLTETTGPVSISHPDDNRAGSVGPPMPGNEVRVKNVNADGIGELWIRGDAVMKGYHRNPKANAEAFDAEGFFNTGDLGRVDEGGRIHVTGRLKNVIVLDSGKNVYPEEIEETLKTSEHIAEAAVFGRAAGGRETVFAVVVPGVRSAGAFELMASEIARLNAGLPPHKRVMGFAVSFDPLPRNSTRKVLLNEVRRTLDLGDYQTSAAGAPVLRKALAGITARDREIVEALREALGVETLYAGSTLADFRIDSLGMIELVVCLEEKLGIEIEPERLRAARTLEDILAHLSSCPPRKGPPIDKTILHGEISTRAAVFRNPLNELFLLAVRAVSRLCWGLRVDNGERLAADNAVIIANHQSNLDVLWILSSLPYRSRRNVYLIGKKELSFLKYVFVGAPVIFVERGGNVIPTLKAGADLLRQGKSLVIFPEGTRGRDGSMGEFRTGAAYLAKNLGKKIVPVAIRGSFEILPRGKIVPRLFSGARARLSAGRPIDPSRYRSVEDLNEAMRDAIARLLQG